MHVCNLILRRPGFYLVHIIFPCWQNCVISIIILGLLSPHQLHIRASSFPSSPQMEKLSKPAPNQCTNWQDARFKTTNHQCCCSKLNAFATTLTRWGKKIYRNYFLARIASSCLVSGSASILNVPLKCILLMFFDQYPHLALRISTEWESIEYERRLQRAL